MKFEVPFDDIPDQTVKDVSILSPTPTDDGAADTLRDQVKDGFKVVTRHLQQLYKTLRSVENWTDFTLQNGWAAAGGAFETPGYYKDLSNRVYIRGHLIVSLTPGLLIATLPGGYRPAGTCRFVVFQNSAFTYLEIRADGTVIAPSAVNPNGLSINCSFRVP